MGVGKHNLGTKKVCGSEDRRANRKANGGLTFEYDIPGIALR